jgi:DMSO reductase anchor subunit
MALLKFFSFLRSEIVFSSLFFLMSEEFFLLLMSEIPQGLTNPWRVTFGKDSPDLCRNL